MIKVDKQLPAVTVLDPQARRPVQGSAQVQAGRRTAPAAEQSFAHTRSSGASFNLQLNQQLSSMQSADSYLGDLAQSLSQLKLSLSRELGKAQVGERDGLQQELDQVNKLLAQRRKRSAQSLDSSMRLRLNEPVRSRFSMAGIDSMAQVQEAGKETLLFSAGRKLSEPLAVVLDEGLSEQQILRRFNNGLSPAGIRAELQSSGALVFSVREDLWEEIGGQLRIQGEGKLADKSPAPLHTHDEQLLELPEASRLESARDLRGALNEVVGALDKVTVLREQLQQRQEEIREFLARHAASDEREWAQAFASDVFSLMQRSPNSYAAVSQTVVAQANLSRNTVVSLLS